MKKAPVLILGARSDIGNAVAHKFAELGYSIQLAARNVEDLNDNKSDIQLRYGVHVSIHEFDALSISTHERFVSELPELPSIVVCAVGIMGTQQECEHDIDASITVMRSNFEGPVSILSILANSFIEKGSGTLVGISSVAGDRGRKKNYIYGSSKAGFTAFLSGLRNRTFEYGVHVVTVLPGFVNTKMTASLDLPRILTAQPYEIAEAIAYAVSNKQNIIYVRPIWKIIMIIIRHIPEIVFKRLNI